MERDNESADGPGAGERATGDATTVASTPLPNEKAPETGDAVVSDSVTAEAPPIEPPTIEPQTVAQSSPPADPSELAAEPGSARDRVARFLAVLALLALGALFGVGWHLGTPLLADRDTRLADMETRLGQIEGDLTRQVSESVAPVAARLGEVAEQVSSDAAAQRSAIVASETTLNDQMRRLDGRLRRVDERLARLTATDRRAWLVQEAAFIVRLAGQRLAAARDVASARALLQTADDLLLEADDPLLDGARRALASDLMLLRSVKTPDWIGIDARLEALLVQAGKLSLVRAPTTVPSSDKSDDWLARAGKGWRAALAKFSDYLVIRERSEDLSSLLTPDWEVLVRQNLRMLLEQAQIALLSGNAPLYRRALVRARQFAELFVDNDPAGVTATVDEIDALLAVNIAPELPALLDSRRALADATRLLTAADEN